MRLWRRGLGLGVGLGLGAGMGVGGMGREGLEGEGMGVVEVLRGDNGGIAAL